MLSELIYISKRSVHCTDDDVKQILNESTRQNNKRDITGVLLYSKTKFVQVLEGESDTILGLYDHIKKDRRHYHPLLVSLQMIEKRYFPSWQMGSKGVEEDYDFFTPLDRRERNIFEQLLSGKNSSKAVNLINKIFHH